MCRSIWSRRATPGEHKGGWRFQATNGSVFGSLTVIISVPVPATATPLPTATAVASAVERAMDHQLRLVQLRHRQFVAERQRRQRHVCGQWQHQRHGDQQSADGDLVAQRHVGQLRLVAGRIGQEVARQLQRDQRLVRLSRGRDGASALRGGHLRGRLEHGRRDVQRADEHLSGWRPVDRHVTARAVHSEWHDRREQGDGHLEPAGGTSRTVHLVFAQRRCSSTAITTATRSGAAIAAAALSRPNASSRNPIDCSGENEPHLDRDAARCVTASSRVSAQSP